MSNTSLYTTTVTQNVGSNNYTTLYSGTGAVTAVTSYGNSNVTSLLNAGTDGGNTIANIVATGNITVGGGITAGGNVTAQTFIGNFAGNITGNITVPGANTDVIYNYQGNAGATSSFTFNQASNVLTVIGNISANYFIGNGAYLTGLPNGAVANFANYAANITLANQPNITSVGTLPNLNAGNITVTGNIIGNLIPNANATYNLGNASNQWKELYLTGNSIYLGAQTISSNANGVIVTGNLYSSGANLGNSIVANYFIGSGNNLSNIQGSNVTGNVTSAITANYANFANYVVWPNQSNITSLGTLSALTITGNLTSGNAQLGNSVNGNYFIGNGYFLTSLQASQIIGNVPNASYANFANYAGNVVVGNQPNITSIGTLGNLSVTNNITGGNANIGNITLANGVGSLNFPFPSGSGSHTNDYGNIVYGNAPGVGFSNGLAIYSTINTTVYAYNNLYLTGTNVLFTGNTYLGSNASLFITGGSNGQYLTTDGNANLRWTSSSGGGAGNANISGANTQIFFNNANSNTLGTSANLTFNNSTNTLTATNIAGTTINITGNLTSGNANLGNAVIANYHIGSGNNLSNIQGSNVTGNVTSAITANFANYAGNVTVANQPNITSTGTLANLNLSGNVTSSGNITAPYFLGNVIGNISGNIVVPGLQWNVLYNNSGNAGASNNFIFNATTNVATITGNVVANYFIGSGNNLSNIQGANVSGTVANANYAAYSGIAASANSVAGANVSGQVGNALIAGTVYTNAQPNITSVGTLSVLNVTGNISSANYILGNGAFLTGLPNGAYANFANYAGNVTVNSQPNITSVGTLSVLNVTGNISSGNANLGNAVVANFFIGSGNNLSNIQAANITGTIANANYSNYSNVANTANSVAVANVVGIGNIATINLNGNGSQVLYGNGVFASAGTVANANYAAYAGNITVNAQPNITSVGTLTSLSVTGNISAGNISVSGLETDGNLVVNANIQTSNINISNVANFAPLGTNPTYQQGYVWYDSVNDSLNYYNSVANSIINIGQEVSILVYNQSGATIAAGSVCYISGTHSQQPQITLAQANASATSGAIGINQLAIPNNSNGYLTILGAVTNLNTSSYTAGDTLYLSATTAGGFANTPPVINNGSSNVIVRVGFVTYSNPSVGKIFTSVRNVSVAGANVIGQVGNALIAGTVYTNAQPNITSVGTLTSLSVTGNITSGNESTGNLTSNGIVNFTSASNVSLGAVGNVKITGGTSGYYLQTDGTGNLSWAAGGGGGGGTPGGSNTQVQFNDGGSFGGNANLTFNKTTGALTINATSSNTIITGTNINTYGSFNLLNSAGNSTLTYNASAAQPGLQITSTANIVLTPNNSSSSNLYTNSYGVSIVTGNAGVSITTGGSSTTGTANVDLYSGASTSETNLNFHGVGIGTYIGTLSFASGSNAFVISSTGNVNITPTGNTNLGSNAKVKITGGSANQYLQTDGTGNLSWATAAGGSSTTDFTPSFLLGGM